MAAEATNPKGGEGEGDGGGAGNGGGEGGGSEGGGGEGGVGSSGGGGGGVRGGSSNDCESRYRTSRCSTMTNSAPTIAIKPAIEHIVLTMEHMAPTTASKPVGVAYMLIEIRTPIHET